MSAALSPLLRKTLSDGDPLSSAHGGRFQSCIMALAFDASPSLLTSPPQPRAILEQFQAAIATLDSALNENQGSILSSTTANASLYVIACLPVPITAAAFFSAKIVGQFASASTASAPANAPPLSIAASVRFCVISFGDILWRSGLSGGIIPYGKEVDEVTAQFQVTALPSDRKGEERAKQYSNKPPPSPRYTQLLLASPNQPPGAVYCSSSAVSAQQAIDGESCMISFSSIPDHPKWEAPNDKFSRAVNSVRSSSSLAGRQSIRKVLSDSLEMLLISNTSSLSILESRAGFGKSKLASEVVQVSSRANQAPCHMPPPPL